MSRKVSFLELCHSFDGQVKLPYSTGCNWSYCKGKSDYDMHHWFYELDENLNIDETED